MKNFSKLIGMAMAALVMVSLSPAANAQDDKAEMRRVRQERNEAKRNAFKRSPKEARKEAKKLQKEGWKTMSLPIEKQLEDTWERMMMVDATTGHLKYIWAQNQANAQSFSAAQMQAENMARISIAESIASSVASLADIALANREITPEQSATVQEAVRNSKVLVAQKLGRVYTSECIYKQNKNQYTVRVIVLYDTTQAAEIARQAIKEELADKMKENGEQLDRLMGLDKVADALTDTFDQTL